MKRSKFSLSHYKLFTCDMGELIPCGLLEVLPGDSFQHNTSLLVRCAPLLAPVMHPVEVRIHHFFVPHRLVWEDFEDFITGGPDGNDDTVAPYRVITAGNPTLGSLADYLGVPPGAGPINVSALPLRGYALIWNEYFRDADLQAEANINYASGEDTSTSNSLKMCGWEKDYFTSARPWEQKGPAITIPLGSTAPVLGIGKASAVWSATPQTVRESDGTTSTFNINSPVTDSADTRFYVERKTGDWPNIRADLSSASAVTVNVLREAMALQRYEEARARYGSRYTEYLRYLGVRSSDARLQRPEYLGGGRQTIQFSEVLQTAEGATTPVGTMVGHGIGAMRSNRYRRFFEEHGYIYSLMSVRPKTMYVQGLKRHWSKTTKEDYWQRELQHIGQQPIKNKEVYAMHTSKENTFGYQDRYDEYRRQESSIAGEFRNSILDYWHMGRVFASDPALNAAFIQCDPTDRIFAAPDQDTLYVMANHHVIARRMVAKTGASFIF